VYIPFQKLDIGGGHLAVELDWPVDLRLAKLDFETRAEACDWTPADGSMVSLGAGLG